MNLIQFPIRMAAERGYLRLVQASRGRTNENHDARAPADDQQQVRAYEAAVSEGWPDRPVRR
jgi:hypothetical protein